MKTHNPYLRYSLIILSIWASRLILKYMLNTSQYVDALRLGNIQQFKEIEEASGDWWSPNMDRGAGACLHFAADHGQVSHRRQ